MSVEVVLKNKIIKNPIVQYKRELEEIVNSNLISKLLLKNKLKKEVAEFGLYLLKLKDNYTSVYVSLGSEELKEFEKWIKADLWEDNDYFDLLIYFFGIEKAKYVKQAWNSLPQKMYQNGYARRSFRAPNNKRYLLVNQINFLRSLVVGSYSHTYQDGSTYYNLTFEEQMFGILFNWRRLIFLIQSQFRLEFEVKIIMKFIWHFGFKVFRMLKKQFHICMNF